MSETRQPLVVCMANVAAEQVSWLWRPYIPRRKLTWLEGDPGIGKTWLALALAAAITQGKSPFGGVGMDPGTVLYLTAEDGLGDTLRPRLDAAGADVDRVHVLVGWREGETNGCVTLGDINVITSALEQVKPALVVVDPLQAFLGASVDMHRANETRPLLASLAALAEAHECAVLGIRHLTKLSQPHAIYRGIGSIDFAAAARSILLVGQHPEQPAQRIMAQSKSSLAAAGPSLAFELREGTFVWCGESELTADQLLGPQLAPTPPTERDEAKAFLEEMLQEGAQPARTIFSEARKAKISEITLRRAKTELGVESRKVTVPAAKDGAKPRQAWAWQLPGAGDHQDAQPRTPPLSVPGDHLDHQPQTRANPGSQPYFQDDHNDHLDDDPQHRASGGLRGRFQDDHRGPLGHDDHLGVCELGHPMHPTHRVCFICGRPRTEVRT
jgi:AAA domain